jgi:DNA ligase-1
MLVYDGVGYSRSLKPLPNKCLQDKIQKNKKELEGFDGEIIVGNPIDEFCFKESNRACMKIDLEAEHTFHIFDRWDQPEKQYMQRLASIAIFFMKNKHISWITPVLHTPIYSMVGINNYADACLKLGYEGAIFQSPQGFYKHGRASAKSGLMYKYKSRIDTEITVTDFHELMINNNPKVVNELGRSSRSSHKENLVPGNTLGAISGSGFFEDGTPFTTKVGVFSGFTKEDLKAIWDSKHKLSGKLMKIKYMGIGSDQAPRTPVALGFRDIIDL